ncbi:hypothetical protein ACBI99_44980 [Nonomuraea sp. ATR24]|uniref:hypothetical protein n=1 Tax=Nonomuraea sp. ATR24 TaxID=1676744 RepID=UPI0035BFED07
MRRLKSHEALSKDSDGPFTSMASTLLFAASVGYANGRSGDFSDTNEPIGYGVFRRSSTAVPSSARWECSSIQAIPSILSNERLGEGVAIFDESANGGLNYMRGDINASKSCVMDVLLETVRQAIRNQSSGNLPPELGQFFGPLEF